MNWNVCRRYITIFSISLLTLPACSSSKDWRTDEEKAAGVVLTEEVIQIRKDNQAARIQWWNRESIRVQKEMEMNRMTHCHTGNYLDCIR